MATAALHYVGTIRCLEKGVQHIQFNNIERKPTTKRALPSLSLVSYSISLFLASRQLPAALK